MSESRWKMQTYAFIYFTAVTPGKTFKRNCLCGKNCLFGETREVALVPLRASNLLQMIVKRAVGLARAGKVSASDKGPQESL